MRTPRSGHNRPHFTCVNRRRRTRGNGDEQVGRGTGGRPAATGPSNLFSLEVDAPEVDVHRRAVRPAGAARARRGRAEPMLGRPYSFVNPPGTRAARVLLHHRARGTAVAAARGARARRPAVAAAARQRLLLASARCRRPTCCGASRPAPASAPFLSMLRTPEPWERFARVVLVHAVRHAERTHLSRHDRRHRAPRIRARSRYVPMVSREAHPGALRGRIPARDRRRPARGARRACR